MRKNVLATEEGAVPATTSTTAAATVPCTTTAATEAMPENATAPAPAVQCSMELGGRLVDHRDDVAQVRMVRKQAKREAKRQRVERAEQRVTSPPVKADEVERAVVELDDACRAKRQQQADAARDEVEERRTRRMTESQTQGQRDEQCARVSLVQR